MTTTKAEDLPLLIKLQAVRNGMTFREVLMIAAGTPELVAQFDRLTGANLSRKGLPIELLIDDVTGRMESDLRKFIEFVWDGVFLRFGSIEDKKQ